MNLLPALRMTSATSQGGRFTTACSPAGSWCCAGAADRDLIERIDRGVQMALRQVQIDGGVFQVRMAQQKLDRPQIGSGFHQVWWRSCGEACAAQSSCLMPARAAASWQAYQTVLSEMGCFHTRDGPRCWGTDRSSVSSSASTRARLRAASESAAHRGRAIPCPDGRGSPCARYRCRSPSAATPRSGACRSRRERSGSCDAAGSVPPRSAASLPRGLSTTGSFFGVFGKSRSSKVEIAPLQGLLVEEAQGRHAHLDRAGRKFLLVEQVELEAADLLRSQSAPATCRSTPQTA